MLSFENYKNNFSRPIITFLIGPPASGKSTWIKKSVIPGDAIILSRDNILEDFIKDMNISYSESFYDTDLQDEINYILNYHIKKTIESNKNIIVDMTNITRDIRNKILSIVPDNYIKNAVVFEINTFELIRRLQKREKETGKHIKKGITSSMLYSYEKPTLNEFDNIEYYQNN